MTITITSQEDSQSCDWSQGYFGCHYMTEAGYITITGISLNLSFIIINIGVKGGKGGKGAEGAQVFEGVKAPQSTTKSSKSTIVWIIVPVVVSVVVVLLILLTVILCT